MALDKMPTADAGRPPHVELKWSLTRRLLGTAMACFTIATFVALFETYRDVRRADETLAGVVARQMPLFRITADIDIAARVPDPDLIVSSAQSSGQCIKYITAGGIALRSSCVAVEPETVRAPAWFSFLCGRLFGPPSPVNWHISYLGRPYGTLVVTTNKTVVLAAIWKEASGLLSFTALVIAATCTLQFAAISRALRPTKSILSALDTFGRGDLSCRLPSFRLVEFQRIGHVFNRLAANLEMTTHEKIALAAKLVDSQEQERCRLARELHDELAQNLSAVTVIAASIKVTAEIDYAALVPEVDKLAEASMAIMKSLHTTLRALRLPAIDDLGLEASLWILVAERERWMRGALRISLEITGDVRSLSPPVASHVYRIVQEGLTNIAKHAGATHARVRLDIRADADKVTSCRDPWLNLVIEDDGRGLVAGKDGKGLGLIGIRERVTALGGHFATTSGTGRGFALRVSVPFATRQAILR